MNMVNLNDLYILSSYNFIENASNNQNTHLLSLKWVKQGSTWTQELIQINKSDVTCLTLFLSFFGLGKLKHVTISLNQIASYLASYDWQQISQDIYNDNLEEENTYYQAFKTICHIANRQLLKRKTELFQNVSEAVAGDFNHYWNPAMNGYFLLGLHHYYLPNAKGIELRFKDSNELITSYQSLTKDEVAVITVGYQYELRTETTLERNNDDDLECVTMYHYHYPQLPYFQVHSDNKLFPNRNYI